MILDEELDQSLAKLRDAISPRQSIVEGVMARISAGTGPVVRSRAHSWLIPSWHSQFAIGAAIAIAVLFAGGWLLLGERSSSAFANQALAALQQAKTEGVTLKEQNIVVLADGTRHTSSTSSKLFVGRDSYRRDIYENDNLRESQWYTQKGDGMLQTSVRFDSKTYTQQSHTGGYGNQEPVARMSLLVKFIDRAERRLNPLEIRGAKCPGYEIRASKYGNNPADWIDRIWFDPATKLPVRIEQERPRKEQQFKSFVTVQEQFEWHPDLAADTFTARIPNGFTLQK